MRVRLVTVLVMLMAGILFTLGVPLGMSILHEQQGRFFQDRVDDAAHFAALAENARPGVSLSAVQAELVRYEQVYGVSSAVVDRNGQTLIVTVGYPGNTVGDTSPELRQAFAGRHSGDGGTIWPWGRKTLTVTAPVVHSGDVVGAVVTVSATERMRHTVLGGWILLFSAEIGALVLCLTLAHYLARWMLRPVQALGAATHTIAKGRLDTRVAAKVGPPEIRRLAMSFNDMVDHVEAAMERQRTFVADASHQLRNPLSGLMLRLDVLSMTLPPGTEKELSDVRGEAKRLTRVLDDLLDLALAEEGTAQPERVELTELVGERVDGWQIVADQQDIRVVRDWNGPVPALADPTGVGSAFDAVIDNAIKFSPVGGQVRVEVRGTPDTATIRVADQGPGLPPEELARAGDRFWRSPRHQNIDGSGLGLSVARTLLAASGGSLHVTVGADRGLVVTMSVPGQGLIER